MAQVISDRRDIEFVLYEQLGIQKLFSTDRYSYCSRQMFDMIISEVRNFSIKELLPAYIEGDKEGVKYENGKVFAPECFRKPYEKFVEGGWFALTESNELGGQALPHVIAQAAYEYMVGANYPFMDYPILAHGAGKMIELFGTEKQKSLFVEKLYKGIWGGSMLLTEPNAGSDVGALTTSAVQNNDGTYSIMGNKIFITNGEQNITPNIIHPVLARIEGAPSGTKGISLFIVPRIWVNSDGSLGEFNDVVCTGIEKKMGLHSSPTCSLTLGGKGKCRGWLLGQENQGMQIMFNMMNEVRLEVGTQAFTNASTAYLYALEYAKQRIQGKDIGDSRNANAQGVNIIRHPDVRRMLLRMKSYVDGMRSLIYYVAYCFDQEEIEKTEERKEHFSDLIAILTPVVKAYCSEKGFDMCVEAMQVYGGYGYTKEYPIEQIVRDCKIASIYEGTNGIQAMDFLGRKLGMKQGAAFKSLIKEMKTTVESAIAVDDLKDLAESVQNSINALEDVAAFIVKLAVSDQYRVAFAFAHPLLEAVGDVVIGWMHLWRLTIALPKRIEKAGDKSALFYDGQIRAAKYFIRSVLPITLGKFNAIKNSDDSAIRIDEKSFSN